MDVCVYMCVSGKYIYNRRCLRLLKIIKSCLRENM